MGKWVLDGPPGSQFVDPDEALVFGQTHSLGSGALGGWSQANLGGFFAEDPSGEVREELRALRRGNGHANGNGAAKR